MQRHFDLIKTQKERLGTTRGFIAVKPNCSIQSYTPALASMERIWTKRSCCNNIPGNLRSRKDIQRLAGNDREYHSIHRRRRRKRVKKNLFVYSEHWKTEKSNLAEEPKITCQCLRVPVLNGHTAPVFINFEKKPTKEQLIEKLESFKGFPQEAELPSAPKQFIQYLSEDDRPQVKADVNYENGMGVSIGRLREDSMYDYKFIGLSHNTVRGAAGGAVLCARSTDCQGIYSGKVARGTGKQALLVSLVAHSYSPVYRS